MSNTLHLYCLDCSERLCIGQGQKGYFRVYSEDEYIERLKEFINLHLEHRLASGDIEYVPDTNDETIPIFSRNGEWKDFEEKT